MNNRLTTITVILNTIGDQLQPPAASPWHEHSRAALAATTWITCPKCKGDKILTWKNRQVKCDHRYCNGQGGWFTDPYDQTQQPVATITSDNYVPAKHIPCVECGAKGVYPNGHPCKLCHGACELILWAEPDLGNTLHGIAEAATRTQHPGYQAVVTALAALHAHSPAQHFAVCYTHVLGYQQPRNLDLPMRHLIVMGLVWINRELGPTWRPPAYARHQADTLTRIRQEAARRARGTGRWADPARRSERDQEIRRLHANGRSIRQIATHMQLGKSIVGDIVNARNQAA